MALFSRKNSLNKKKYKPYYYTYTISSFALLAAGLYPTKSCRLIRIKSIIISVQVVSLLPILGYYFLYIWKCILTKNIANLLKQFSVGVLVVLLFYKIILVSSRNDLFCRLLQTVTTDLLKANSVGKSYRDIYDKYIKLSKLREICWAINGNGMMTCFPVLAAIKLVYGYIIKDQDNMRSEYMVHEMEFKYLEDKQFETPYFGIIWIYMTYVCSLMFLSFLGFDASFCILTTHAALKIKLMAHAMSNTFKMSRTKQELKYNLRFIIRDHQEAIDYYNLIQQFYSLWLFIVFLVTSLDIALNLYLVTVGDEVDIKYTMFAICCVVHSFIPCTFATILFEVGDQLPNDIYSCGWERSQDPEITRMVTFMIARAQQPLQLTGAGFVPFNMELFVKIVKSSYSLYTLLKD